MLNKGFTNKKHIGDLRGGSMSKKIVQNMKNLILILLFGIVAYIFYNLIDREKNIIELMLLIFIIYFSIVCALSTINNIFNNKFLKRIINLFFIPLDIILSFNELISFCLPVIVFLLTYFLPTAIFKMIGDSYNVDLFSSDGFLYIINVITVLLFAYYGDNIMNKLFEIFKVNSFRDKIVYVFMTKKLIRAYTYFVMVAVYIVYNYCVFNNIPTILGYQPDNFNVLKEVFVTFVAVDTMIQIIKTKELNSLSKIKEERDDLVG